MRDILRDCVLFYAGCLGKSSLKKMIFEQRPEGRKRENHLGVWINTFPAEKTITKTL